MGTPVWQTLIEVELAVEAFTGGDPDNSQLEKLMDEIGRLKRTQRD